MQNATALQSKLDEQERLLSVLDRAKMQEALNAARGQLDDVLGDDVPTFAEVERKILNRHTVAEAKGELSALQASAQVDPGLLEIEAAQRSAEAQALLVQMRERLGNSPTPTVPACSNGEARAGLLSSCALARPGPTLDPNAQRCATVAPGGDQWRTRP